MSDDFAQFREAFFEEAAEHLAIVEEGLLALEQHPEDLELLAKIFRSAHSIKGASGMFGFNAVTQFTHKMETLLDLLRNGEKAVSPQIADLLLKSTDCLKTLIEAVKSGMAVDDETVQRLTAELASASASGVQPPAVPQEQPVAASAQSGVQEHSYLITWTPPEWLFQRGLDPLQILKELSGLGDLSSVTLDMSRVPDLAEVDPEKCYLSWELRLVTGKDLKTVESAFEFVREDSKLIIEEIRGKELEGKSDVMSDSSQPTTPPPSPLTRTVISPNILGKSWWRAVWCHRPFLNRHCPSRNESARFSLRRRLSPRINSNKRSIPNDSRKRRYKRRKQTPHPFVWIPQKSTS